MTGHLYLHIGPPKSGTTSLQYALERIEHPAFVYGGVCQPRERNSGSLANRLCHALNDDEDSTALEIRDEVISLVNAGKQVVLSEEMLLLTEKARTWQNKLSLLNIWFRDIPTTVVISLRDPAQGVPSLYQELFDGLPLHQKLSFSRFCESDRASCYDFTQILELLAKLEFDEIRFITFDAILRGKIASEDLFGESDVLHIQEIPIGHSNVGTKRNGHAERQLNGVTLKSLGRLPVVRKLIDRFGLRRAPAYRLFVAGLDKITLQSPGYHALTMPTPSAERFQVAYLSAIAALNNQ